MMLVSVLRRLCKISAYFNLDILWRISQGLSPLDHRLLTWRLLQAEAKELTFERDGTLWTCNAHGDVVGASLYFWGRHQGPHIDALLNWMNQRKRLTASRNIILDIGANIGTSCIPFAQKTAAQILAIEPVPENFQLLHRNVIQNGLEHRIIRVQKAIYHESACLEMAVPEGNQGGAFVTTNKDYKKHEELFESGIREKMQVSGEPLMKILGDCHVMPEQVAFVWCDVEGCETEVIATGEALWRNGAPIFLEINPRALKIQGALQSLPGLVSRYFDRYFTSGDLLEQGTEAKARPISDLATLIDDLRQIEMGLMDVLLLPRWF